MHPRRYQLVFFGVANSRLKGLGDRDWGTIGIEKHKELAFRPGFNRLTKHAGGIIPADGFHIGQKAIANGLKLFGAD